MISLYIYPSWLVPVEQIRNKSEIITFIQQIAQQ
ncbi:hypothetical protein NIES22_20010 [Calothrix brevissima NIES-22]|nr:hypothetical protein NIES22_20010 [Calothrix brevissima NIES-22]